MARVKVVLRQDVDKLGRVGEIVAVTGGFARNFLIPRGLALPATKGNLRQAESWKQLVSTKASKERAGAVELKAKLESGPLEVRAQAGPDGRLFGSITSTQIAEAIAAKHGLTIDRHIIQLEDAIRHLGFHEVHVRLHPEVSATVTVEAVES